MNSIIKLILLGLVAAQTHDHPTQVNASDDAQLKATHVHDTHVDDTKSQPIKPTDEFLPLVIGANARSGTIQVGNPDDTCDLYGAGYGRRVAVNNAIYGLGKACDMCVEITNPNAKLSIQARVVGNCIDCDKDFTLTSHLFSELKLKDSDPIEWSVVRCEGHPIGKYMWSEGSNTTHGELRVYHLVEPVGTIEYDKAGQWVVATYQSNGLYEIDHPTIYTSAHFKSILSRINSTSNNSFTRYLSISEALADPKFQFPLPPNPPNTQVEHANQPSEPNRPSDKELEAEADLAENATLTSSDGHPQGLPTLALSAIFAIPLLF
ncbi:hypothetical protein L0F63_003286 [Massospora cicadina]|nr:hypothetical protein L0F63_003286 [Massospora cicadina]